MAVLERAFLDELVGLPNRVFILLFVVRVVGYPRVFTSGLPWFCAHVQQHNKLSDISNNCMTFILIINDFPNAKNTNTHWTTTTLPVGFVVDRLKPV